MKRGTPDKLGLLEACYFEVSRSYFSLSLFLSLLHKPVNKYCLFRYNDEIKYIQNKGLLSLISEGIYLLV